MANYSFAFKDDELSHHGIEGQKWGVRNGPPYPLDAGDHSKAELRAMRKDSKRVYKEIKKNSKEARKEKTSTSSKVSEGAKVNQYLLEMKNNIPEINDYIKAQRAWQDLIQSEKVQTLLEKEARKSFKTSGLSNTHLDYWVDMYKNDGDIYLNILSKDPNFKRASDALDKMYDLLRPKYKTAAENILGKYADEQIDGRKASDILVNAMYYYFE